MKMISKNLTMDYPGCRALDHVSVSLESGKCYALLGKNGSGKSTFVKLFAGVIEPTEGELYLDDAKLDFKSPSDAYAKGIVTVYQEMSLVPGLTVAENIFLNRMPIKNGVIDWRKAYKDAATLLKNMQVEINPKDRVMDLSMWQKQIVEITKAMSHDPKVLMLDEPTSALAQSEVANLHNVVNRLKKEKDIIIIYITHKLQELTKIADEVVVIRDGVLIGQESMSKLNHHDIINMMFGKVQIKSRPKDIEVRNENVLEVRHLSREKFYQDINFTLKKGEVLGIAGMLGSGRTELLRGIFGAEPPQSGSVIINGKPVKKPSPMQMKALGVALTPEERKTEGVILRHSILDNLCYACMKRTSKGLLENKKLRVQLAKKQIEELYIKIPDINAPVSSLSGGNQQKVVVGNWLNTLPEIMIYDEPSRGIDVNAKQQIFEIMWEQARKGISTIFVSSELEELIEVCNRILIMSAGKIIGQIYPDDYSINDLYAFAMGADLPESARFPQA